MQKDSLGFCRGMCAGGRVCIIDFLYAVCVLVGMAPLPSSSIILGEGRIHARESA